MKIENVCNYIVTGVCAGVGLWKVHRVLLCNPSADVWVARKQKYSWKTEGGKAVGPVLNNLLLLFSLMSGHVSKRLSILVK